MSALACFMSDKGHTVAGSDRAFDQDPSHPVAGLLRSKRISLVPQDGNGIDASFDLAVFSAAVEPDRPEVARAREIGVPARTRPELLADIVRDFETILVAGTSGKSTTSGMLAFLMERLGLAPNFIGGGRVKQFHDARDPGNSLSGRSRHLVMEACESDGSIVNYKPLHSVILNLDFDHHPVDTTAGMFRRLIQNTSGRIVLNRDDDNLKELGISDAVTFSMNSPSDFRAEDVVYGPFKTHFSVGGTAFRLSLPGRHNLSNALSCIATLNMMNIPLAGIASVLHEFEGIERRFDIVLDDGKHLVIDDYAHNPPQDLSADGNRLPYQRENMLHISAPRFRSHEDDEERIYQNIRQTFARPRSSHPSADLLRRRHGEQRHIEPRPCRRDQGSRKIRRSRENER